MTTLTPTAFRLRYPQFDSGTYPDPVVTVALADAALEMNETQWGSFYERGAYALAAHMLTINAAGGAAAIGGVRSRSIGDVSVTFADGAIGLDAQGTTGYGCEYVRLRNLISGGPVVV